MAQKIKAIGLEVYGDASVLKNVQIDDPTPGPLDLKVRVKAVSVNPGKFLVHLSPSSQKQRKAYVSLSSIFQWIPRFVRVHLVLSKAQP
jgi:NADPH:quinone reductase-like Zn-dependent oxidoreductase